MILRNLFLIAIATAPAVAQSPSTPRATLLAADQSASRASLRHGFAAAMGEVFANDVALIYDGAPLCTGRSEAIQLLRVQRGLAALRIQWLPLTVLVSDDGALGVTAGVSVIARRGQPADSALQYGEYIRVWRREPDGAWRIVALVENGLTDPDSLLRPPGWQPQVPSGIAGPGRPFAAADEAFAQMAIDSGGPKSFGAFAAPDLTTPLAPGNLYAGNAGVVERMQARPSGRMIWEWRPLIAGSSTGGELGYTVGESLLKTSSAPDATRYPGKYLTVWRRQPDGSIKFSLDSGNGGPTLTAFP